MSQKNGCKCDESRLHTLFHSASFSSSPSSSGSFHTTIFVIIDIRIFVIIFQAMFGLLQWRVFRSPVSAFQVKLEKQLGIKTETLPRFPNSSWICIRDNFYAMQLERLAYDMQPWYILRYTRRKFKYDFTKETSREMWDTWDPTLISEVNISMNTIWSNVDAMGGYFAPPRMHGPERFKIMYTRAQGLFAAANIFSSLKLVYIFSVNPYLGPLQVIWHALLIVKVTKLSFWPFSNPGGELVCASNIIPARCHWAWWFSDNVQLCKTCKICKICKIWKYENYEKYENMQNMQNIQIIKNMQNLTICQVSLSLMILW